MLGEFMQFTRMPGIAQTVRFTNARSCSSARRPSESHLLSATHMQANGLRLEFHKSPESSNWSTSIRHTFRCS